MLDLHAPPRAARDTPALVARWREHGDVMARDELVRTFTPLAAHLARRCSHPGGEPLDDLVQVAVVGLIKAVDRFEPRRGFAFASYATPTILGELRHYFRDSTWSVHLPRSVQEHTLLVDRAILELSRTTGRTPSVARTQSDIAEAVGLSQMQVSRVLARCVAAMRQAALGDD